MGVLTWFTGISIFTRRSGTCFSRSAPENAVVDKYRWSFSEHRNRWLSPCVLDTGHLYHDYPEQIRWYRRYDIVGRSVDGCWRHWLWIQLVQCRTETSLSAKSKRRVWVTALWSGYQYRAWNTDTRECATVANRELSRWARSDKSGGRACMHRMIWWFSALSGWRLVMTTLTATVSAIQ